MNYYNLITVLKKYTAQKQPCVIILNKERCTVNGYNTKDKELLEVYKHLKLSGLFDDPHRVYIYQIDDTNNMHGKVLVPDDEGKIMSYSLDDREWNELE